MQDEKALIEDGASPVPIKFCSAPSKICPVPLKICPPEGAGQGSVAQNLSGAGHERSGADQILSGTEQNLSDAGLRSSGTDQFLFDSA